MLLHGEKLGYPVMWRGCIWRSDQVQDSAVDSRVAPKPGGDVGARQQERYKAEMLGLGGRGWCQGRVQTSWHTGRMWGSPGLGACWGANCQKKAIWSISGMASPGCHLPGCHALWAALLPGEERPDATADAFSFYFWWPWRSQFSELLSNDSPGDRWQNSRWLQEGQGWAFNNSIAFVCTAKPPGARATGPGLIRMVQR